MTEFIFGVSAKQRSPVWSLLRVIVVLTLLLSSYAKARYLASGALLDDALLGSRSLGLFTVVFESFFAVSNDRSRPRIAAWLSIATLLRAALVTGSAATKKYLALAEKSCARLVVLDVDNTASDEVIEGALCGRLDSRFVWGVRTPVLLWIDNAIVDKVER